MLRIGEFNKLRAVRDTSVGYFLSDDEGREVLLPNKYVPMDLEVDGEVDVFLYKDSEDRLIATDLMPKIKLNEFAYLKVVETNNVGAFLDWGLEKHLLVPYRQQKVDMEEGRSYVVYMYLDKASGRLAASAKLESFLNNRTLTVEEKDEVDLLVFQKTDLGYGVIINGVHKGLIYNDEVFRPLPIGTSIKGFVKKIREENLIDISLQQQGVANIKPAATIIFEALEKNKGFLGITDKSQPEVIYDTLKMSKKSFKKAVGLLYKERKIRLESDGIYLVG